MAKQTFTTGQVLTAAQMTSLQQTAMGGGSTTAKTVSYVLVAADAGTVVQMNSASATTITVNTALFAAGDTVQIQNVGAGVCTVTAGTATVSTSSTLALKQYDAGTLYFNTTSAAIFFASDAADGSSPLTTKGDIYGFSTLDARIPIGTNNQVLTADSAQALGLKWATPSSSALTKITSTTWTAATSVNINSCFSATYARYRILIKNFAASGQDVTYMKLRVSGTDASTDYYFGFEKVAWTGGTSTVSGSAVTTGFYCGTGVGVRTLTSIDIGNPFETTGTSYNCLGISDNSGITGAGFHTPSTSYDGFSLIWASGTFTGEVVIYGYSN